MPRRSGTTTVWSWTKTAATGAHMSPVSPKPCSMTTAGPLPPTRTGMVAPWALMFCFRKPEGNDPSFAETDDATVSSPIALPQHIALTGIGQDRQEAFAAEAVRMAWGAAPAFYHEREQLE